MGTRYFYTIWISMKKALITGITGQDGSLMAEYLLEKGYDVFGLVRHQNWAQGTLAYLQDRIIVKQADLADPVSLTDLIAAIAPDEIYHFASQSRPGESWARAPETIAVNGMGAIHLFEAVRLGCPSAKVYHASSSEMFGRTVACPQSEMTAFEPASPYAASKVFAHQMAKIYRDSYGLYIANGILFNHESERRPLHFVTQKIAHGAACAALAIQESPFLNECQQPIVSQGKLALGQLEIARDWGYAKDFVRAMWLILQQSEPDDFVIGTGKVHTLRELCDIAYSHVGQSWQDHVVSDPKLVRPLEAHQMVADPSKAARILGWTPSVSFKEMIIAMVDAQIALLRTAIAEI
jgi:GDPmannose 4,6-dehydratase